MKDNYYRYAKVTRVIDGDTFDAEVDLGFGVFVTERFRLLGMNAPEIKGEERPEGLLSKAFLEELVTEKQIVIHSIKQDGFRRYLADAYVLEDGVCKSVVAQMVDCGHAVLREY